MFSTILIILLILLMLGGVGFYPNEQFTAPARGIVGTVILIGAVLWLVKFSGLL